MSVSTLAKYFFLWNVAPCIKSEVKYSWECCRCIWISSEQLHDTCAVDRLISHARVYIYWLFKCTYSHGELEVRLLWTDLVGNPDAFYKHSQVNSSLNVQISLFLKQSIILRLPLAMQPQWDREGKRQGPPTLNVQLEDKGWMGVKDDCLSIYNTLKWKTCSLRKRQVKVSDQCLEAFINVTLELVSRDLTFILKTTALPLLS